MHHAEFRKPRACAGVGASLLLAVFASAPLAHAADPPIETPAAQAEAKKLDALPPVPSQGNKIVVDASGRKESGVGSIYSPSFDGKTMANGQPYSPNANIAASKTLPLGTVAKVTNLENGKSTEVKVKDRGPFVSGRVLDMTPKVASQSGLSNKEGVAPVVVAPVTVPQPDGSVKIGAGAAELAKPPAALKTEAGASAGSR